jgi:hypothetical protein
MAGIGWESPRRPSWPEPTTSLFWICHPHPPNAGTMAFRVRVQDPRGWKDGPARARERRAAGPGNAFGNTLCSWCAQAPGTLLFR